MNKISKSIIFCIAVIISIVSLCVPTYCADISSALYDIDLVNEFPNENNYYNINNINYVTYENFKLERVLGNCFYSSSVSSLPSNYYNGQQIDDNYTISINSEHSINVESSYTLIKRENDFLLSCNKFNVYGLEDLKVNLGKSTTSSSFAFHWIPFEIFNALNGNVNSMHIYGGFKFSYDISYNGQYFYNDTFCFTSDMDLVKGINQYFDVNSSHEVLKSFTLTDNYNDSYNATITTQSSSFHNNKLYIKNLLYSDRYITQVNSSYKTSVSFFGNQTNLYRLYFQYYFKFLDYDETKSINLYSGSTTGSGGAVGSLIPNGSNNFYKTAEWWDIPSHLYNFFIYIIMDAPIVSYFTKLGMFVINFMVESFSFIISLFNGVSNSFFISIFVGILALIFLLKIIFGGKS